MAHLREGPERGRQHQVRRFADHERAQRHLHRTHGLDRRHLRHGLGRPPGQRLRDLLQSDRRDGPEAGPGRAGDQRPRVLAAREHDLERIRVHPGLGRPPQRAQRLSGVRPACRRGRKVPRRQRRAHGTEPARREPTHRRRRKDHRHGLQHGLVPVQEGRHADPGAGSDLAERGDHAERRQRGGSHHHLEQGSLHRRLQQAPERSARKRHLGRGGEGRRYGVGQGQEDHLGRPVRAHPVDASPRRPAAPALGRRSRRQLRALHPDDVQRPRGDLAPQARHQQPERHRVPHRRVRPPG